MGTHESSEAKEPKVPARAAGIVALLNTRPHATPTLPDTLDNPATAAEVLAPFGQPAGVPLTPGQLDQIRAVRTDLMTVIDAADPEHAERGWTNLSADAADATFRQVFSARGEARLEQVAGDQIIGRIALDVAELVRDNTWSRIRACANEQCRHVFYDTTRSRTQRWDSYETCGNRVNVAAHRARGNRPRG
ncbi:CGNR zinc finger domain-containing protein [Micromonospora pisi]|uniref:CGNR zinc finger domain-containing protein n=1 Tax=Micromonospora pisi TaxID=589240 RepID=UPI000EB591FA|nr:CGNR zinc finger domain-containing protein [Micromonospora pisi]